MAYEFSELEGRTKTLSKLRVDIFHGIPIPGYSRVEFRDPFGAGSEFLQRCQL